MASQIAENDVSLSPAYLAAILLTGSVQSAEQAVVRGLDATDRNATNEELLRATVVASTEIMHSAKQHEVVARAVALLPIELQNVLQLPTSVRQCFVLRLLLGVPEDFSARLVDLDVGELDRNIALAAQALAQVSGRKGEVNEGENDRSFSQVRPSGRRA
jgi:DNA-directed RNA polymerase specialized sigma24 family protein